MTQKFLASLVVRNPRNLEKLRYARKPKGFQFEKDWQQRSFYYRAEIEISGKHTTGSIRHFSDGVVITASTREWPISKRLYRRDSFSNVDVSAALNIGNILARRCLQAGITAVHTTVDKDNVTGERVSAFLSGMEKGGLELSEPDFIERNYEVDPDLHWEAKEEAKKHPALDEAGPQFF